MNPHLGRVPNYPTTQVPRTQLPSRQVPSILLPFIAFIDQRPRIRVHKAIQLLLELPQLVTDNVALPKFSNYVN